MRQSIMRRTCNICRAVKDTKVDRPPMGWVGYALSGMREEPPLGHLCPRCKPPVTSPGGTDDE